MSDTLRSKLMEMIASGAETVAFSDTFMGDEGCHVVNDLLRDNTRVKSLDLRGCNIRSDGASALASLLSHNRTLTFLGLEWNGVGMLETGVQSLCKALASNPSIAEVDLRNNSIGPTGGAALGAMLATNTAIRRLDLRWNNLGVHGGRALAESLEKNRHIKELEVSGNKLTEDAVRHIDSLLQRNRGEGAGPPAGSERALGPAPASAAASPGKTAAETGRGSAGRVVVHAPLGAESAAADRSRGDVTKSHGEPLEQTMRAKLLELSQALLDSKEKSVAMERALTEEQRLRADGEVRLRECESVIQELQARIDTTMQSMQGGQRQLTDNLNQERDKRLEQEKRNHALQLEMAQLQDELRNAIDKAGRIKHGSEIEVESAAKELTVTQKQLREFQLQAAEERTALQASLNDALVQGTAAEHALRMEHQAAMSLKEQSMVAASLQHSKQVAALEEQFQESERRRLKVEEELRAALSSIQDLKVEHEQHILTLSEQRRREEEARLGLLDDKIASIQQARELQQQRADQQVLEIQELRRLENARLKDHDAFLKREAQLRMAAEKEVELKHNEVEALNLELLQTRHKLAAAEGALSRLEQLHESKAASQEAALQEVVQEKKTLVQGLEQRLHAVEAQLAAAESDARGHQAELVRTREENLRQLASVEDRLLDAVRKELNLARHKPA